MNYFDDINSRDLKYCLVILEELNLVRAANRVNVTQSTLTYALRRVEKSIGEPLFVRKSKGLEATATAFKFAQQAKIVLTEMSKLKSSARPREMPAGEYLFGCHPVVGQFSLSGVIDTLMTEFPLLQFQFHTNVSKKIQARVESRELDFGIVVNPSAHNELVIRPIARDSFSLWKSKLLGESKILNENKILYFDPSLFQTKTLIEQLARKNFIFGRHVPVTDLNLVGVLASQCGYALLPARVAQLFPLLRQANLLSGTPQFEDHFALIYPQELLKSTGSKLLCRKLEKLLKEKFEIL